MKVAVRYYTKTGNTKRLAEAVAGAVGVEALPISTPITDPVDILFLSALILRFGILSGSWTGAKWAGSSTLVLRQC